MDYNKMLDDLMEEFPQAQEEIEALQSKIAAPAGEEEDMEDMPFEMDEEMPLEMEDDEEGMDFPMDEEDEEME